MTGGAGIELVGAESPRHPRAVIIGAARQMAYVSLAPRGEWHMCHWHREANGIWVIGTATRMAYVSLAPRGKLHTCHWHPLAKHLWPVHTKPQLFFGDQWDACLAGTHIPT